MSGDCSIRLYHEKNYHTSTREPNYQARASDRENLFHMSTKGKLQANIVRQDIAYFSLISILTRSLVLDQTKFLCV